MPQETLVKRVEKLEEEMIALAGLPAQVADLASQVSQLRVEMRVEFSAIRDEIRAGDAETRSQMRILHEDVIARIALLQEGLGSRRRQDAKPSPRGRQRRKTR